MLKIVICDDEEPMLDTIKNIVNCHLEKHKLKSEIHTFVTVEALLNFQDRDDIDVLFLDIDLRTANGVDIAKELRNNKYEGLIIFITSFANYSIAGYKVNAFRFILKDNLQEELDECIQSVVSKFGLRKKLINNQNVYIKNIKYLESIKHKVVIHMENDEKHIVYDTLDNMEKKLNSEHLLRVHKSYLVNFLHIREVRNYRLYLLDNTEIPIPKSKYGEIKKKINIKTTLWG